MYGKNGDKWFTVIFCGCFFLTGVIFSGIAISTFFVEEEGVEILRVVFGLVGVLFLLIAGIFLLVRNRRRRTMGKVRAEGRRLNAVVTAVDWNQSFSMNGRHPYVVNCQFVDGTTVHTFRSENIWFDPSPDIWPGMDISVYVNQDNYNEYWVDIVTPLSAIEAISY